jgi:hypothetical protein
MAIFSNLLYLRKECVKTQDAWIVFQICITQLKSKGGSIWNYFFYTTWTFLIEQVANDQAKLELYYSIHHTPTFFIYSTNIKGWKCRPQIILSSRKQCRGNKFNLFPCFQ